MSLRTTAPCLQALKHLFCCSLLPGKLDRIVTLSPNYEKENWGPKRRAVCHRSHSWTGKDSDQQPIGIPMAVRSFGSSGELFGDMADTYPRSLSQSMTGLCWVLLVFAPLGRGLLKGLPPCRGDWVWAHSVTKLGCCPGPTAAPTPIHCHSSIL